MSFLPSFLAQSTNRGHVLLPPRPVAMSEYNGIQYITIPPNTYMYKGASNCYQEDLRETKLPVWFGTRQTASGYADDEMVSGVMPKLCVYKTRKELKLMAITEHNISLIYSMAHAGAEGPEPAMRTKAAEDLVEITNMMFPPYGGDNRWRQRGIIKRDDFVRKWLEALECSKSTEYRTTSLESDTTLPGRYTTWKQDLKYCQAFCKHFTALTDSVNMDGYYAPELGLSSEYGRGTVHPEVMLCDPYSLIRLESTIPFQSRSSAGSNMRGLVRNGKEVEQEQRLRVRARQFVKPHILLSRRKKKRDKK